MESTMEVPEKTKNRTTLKSSNTTPRHISKGMYSRIQKSHCPPMFTAALFTVARLWKQPRCPTTNEWFKKMWYNIYTIEIYSAIKENEIMLFASKWMELENIMLCKVSQAQKVKKLNIFPHMWMLDLHDHIHTRTHTHIQTHI
jgi:hypothetical protein